MNVTFQALLLEYLHFCRKIKGTNEAVSLFYIFYKYVGALQQVPLGCSSPGLRKAVND
jgi:hypothetical protein